ncbi:hypothetical protein V8J36_12105 [Frigidibacter sp. MR17.14]|uniref:hypothetical protein n=1 Tax=Frigidibacter sp. MR17.14 TaxID=3126509 RepID=UPI003012C64E
MAYTTNTLAAGTAGIKSEGIIGALRRGLVTYMERKSRSVEIDRLNKMTDAELSKLGVTRDRIPHYVFRDMFYV